MVIAGRFRKTEEASITVAAAADLGQAFQEIAGSFEQATEPKWC